MLTATKKAQLIKKFAAGPKDTGSPVVQIALLTEQIKELTVHLKKHRKDNHSRRGLLKIISKRRRLLNYLAKTNFKVFEKITKQLKINKNLGESKA